MVARAINWWRLRRAALARRRFRVLVHGLALAACVGAAGLLLAWWFSTLRPAWWVALNTADPAVTAAATAFENGVVTVLYHRADGTAPERAAVWTASVSATDANAWLAAKGPAWAVVAMGLKQWPPGVSQVQVHFDDGSITLAARLAAGAGVASGGANSASESRGGARHAWVRVVPEVTSTGALRLNISGAGLGRLPLPATLVRQRVDVASAAAGATVAPGAPHPAAAHFALALAGGGGGAVTIDDPALDLADGRRVRLVGVSVEAGTLRLTCRTEPAPARPDPREPGGPLNTTGGGR